MLRNITENDLDKIRRWRNSPDVRKVMFTDHEIGREEHVQWWHKTRSDKTKAQYLYVWNNEDVGVINYFDIDKSSKTCHWGFYLSSDLHNQLQRMQIWQSLEKEAIEYAFETFGCEKLVCESFKFNYPVIEMHKRFGFKEVSVEIKEKQGQAEEVVVTELKSSDYYNHLKDVVLPKSRKLVKLEKSFAFLGSVNLDYLKEEFRNKASAYNISASITDIPYGQYKIQINNPQSDLNLVKHDYLVFIERLEEFVPFNDVLSEDVLPEIENRLKDYIEFIKQARANISGVFLVANFCGVNSWISSLNPSSNENYKIQDVINRANAEIIKVCSSMHDAYVLDLQAIVHKVGAKTAHPGKYWYMAKMPFSHAFNISLSNHILGVLLSVEAKTARVIALDLDNTLWKGVIGDDGIENISIGGDYPGNVYQIIQKTLKKLRDRGLALVLCSKNTEAIALEAFEKRREMVLKMDDFSAWRVNWSPKPQNIKELADEMGLGLSSFCFIDDNPAEREEMRMAYPEVFVPELPAEVSEWPEYIINLPELSDVGLTEEDRKRAGQYKIRAQINSAQKEEGSREDFLKSIGMIISMEKLSSDNQQRILQLIKKTNQFNTTTRRYAESELKALLGNGECYAVRLQDKYGSDEIIGVVIVLYPENIMKIDTFILSCRVLGRGVETAVLAWLYKLAEKRNVNTITGEIIPTDRNTPVRNVYIDHGFADSGNNNYELILSKSRIDMPEWIKVE